MSTALDNIANSLKIPNNDYINTFCSQIEQEMMRIPSDLMEEFKDEVTELLLQKQKRMRSNRLNN
jgi:ABC-type proline/glycine betaine transport system ATPase subunit